MNHFFYGTLMRGLMWNHLLKGQKFLGEAVCPYAKLYLLPSTQHPIPVMVDSRLLKDQTFGELWDINEPRLALDLRAFEVQAGYHPVQRKIIFLNGQTVLARCFIYPEGVITPEFQPVVGGDFRKFLGGRNE